MGWHRCPIKSSQYALRLISHPIILIVTYVHQYTNHPCTYHYPLALYTYALDRIVITLSVNLTIYSLPYVRTVSQPTYSYISTILYGVWHIKQSILINYPY
jgi:hypothetical protein